MEINIMNDSKAYICGGAVRDTLLGRQAKDTDYVVVGANAQDMLNRGYSQVGADFPVFLDSNGNEWALARTERKSGSGYHGFDVDFSTNVTLIDDLLRRDLTINSTAVLMSDWNEFVTTKNTDLVIDPHGGLEDLKNRILRHTSEAFKDDPVRILRIARFMARFNTEFNFQIASSTMELMSEMVENGEVDFLVPERVWAETEKAMMENSPAVFFNELLKCGALSRIMPLFNNVDAFGSRVFNAAAVRNMDLDTRVMTLTSELNVNRLREAMFALRVPNDLVRRCVKFNVLRSRMEKMVIEDAMSRFHRGHIFQLLNDMDAWKNSDELRSMGIVLSLISNPKINKVFDLMISCMEQASSVCFDNLTDDQKATLKGREIAKAISDMRWDIVKMVEG